MIRSGRFSLLSRANLLDYIPRSGIFLQSVSHHLLSGFQGVKPRKGDQLSNFVQALDHFYYQILFHFASPLKTLRATSRWLLEASGWFSSQLFLFVYVDVFGVDHAFILLFLAVGRRRPGLGARRARLRLRRLVHGFGQLVRGLRQPVAR